MKRTVVILSFIFALAIALSVSIPTLAANGDTAVSGTVSPKIVVDAPTTYSFGAALPQTVTAAFNVNVITNAKAWSLKATAPKMSGTEGTLTGALNGSGNGGSNWYALTTQQTLYTGTDKTGASGLNVAIGLYQGIVDGVDYAGSYSTTITFVGTTP